MKKFVYLNKKTGQKVYSDEELEDSDLVVVVKVKNGQMKANKIVQK